MTAYYNDLDPHACATLRELIADGLIAPGDVDERSIADVRPADLAGYTQHHFFAGGGCWSLALRLAGWPDDRPVWTGSCPCPPFSVAGKRKACPACGGELLVACPARTGFFVCADCGHEWLADGRHLWPELWRLVAECRPAAVFGEQVDSDDGRNWLAGVRASLEILGYAVGGSDLCAASVFAPHQRQRLWWFGALADAGSERVRAEGRGEAAGPARTAQGQGRQRKRVRADAGDAGGGERGRVGNADLAGPQGRRVELGERPGQLAARPTGEPRGVANTNGSAGGQGCQDDGGRPARGFAQPRPGPRGAWGDYWIECSDGTVRRVPEPVSQPGLQPLVDVGSVRGRVAALRLAGNAIVAAVAAKWIAACMPETADAAFRGEAACEVVA